MGTWDGNISSVLHVSCKPCLCKNKTRSEDENVCSSETLKAENWWTEKACPAKYSPRDFSPQVVLKTANFASYINATKLIRSWWLRSLKQEVCPVLRLCGWDAVSSPVVFSFRPCELLREPWSLRSFKAEVSGRKKNWTRLKEDFVIWWPALPKRVSLSLVAGEWREFLEGWGEMWITASERKKSAKVCWGRSLWHHHGSFSGSTALRLQRGDFFIYLFNFMPCRPQNGPIACPVPPLWLAIPILSPKTLNGDIVFSLLLFSLG